LRTIRVYPRVCGGARRSRILGVSSRGLSPRVRGSRCQSRAPLALAGSIPACAGEPSGDLQGGLHKGVYPRVCGGAVSCQCGDCHLVGLSPRVRGSHGCLRVSNCHIGSIPACAGEPSIFGL